MHCITDAFTAQRRLSEVGHTCATVFSFCFEEESAGVMAAEALNVKADKKEEEEELLDLALEIKEQCGDENLFSLRPKS